MGKMSSFSRMGGSIWIILLKNTDCIGTSEYFRGRKKKKKGLGVPPCSRKQVAPKERFGSSDS